MEKKKNRQKSFTSLFQENVINSLLLLRHFFYYYIMYVHEYFEQEKMIWFFFFFYSHPFANSISVLMDDLFKFNSDQLFAFLHVGIIIGNLLSLLDHNIIITINKINSSYHKNTINGGFCNKDHHLNFQYNFDD